jgi:hypothetical protein
LAVEDTYYTGAFVHIPDLEQAAKMISRMRILNEGACKKQR